MGAALSLLVLASPTLLVGAAYFALRETPSRMRAAMLVVIGAAWAVAAWFMVSSNQQTDDVGIMVEGMLFLATATSALVASLAALIFWRKA